MCPVAIVGIGFGSRDMLRWADGLHLYASGQEVLRTWPPSFIDVHALHRRGMFTRGTWFSWGVNKQMEQRTDRIQMAVTELGELQEKRRMIACTKRE